jgi:hypothetical protein
MYFTSHAKLQAFAHGEDHRAVWEWWRGLVRDGKAKGLSTAHEVFRVRKGDWEGVYANYFPSLFGMLYFLGLVYMVELLVVMGCGWNR